MTTVLDPILEVEFSDDGALEVVDLGDVVSSPPASPGGIADVLSTTVNFLAEGGKRDDSSFDNGAVLNTVLGKFAGKELKDTLHFPGGAYYFDTEVVGGPITSLKVTGNGIPAVVAEGDWLNITKPAGPASRLVWNGTQGSGEVLVSLSVFGLVWDGLAIQGKTDNNRDNIISTANRAHIGLRIEPIHNVGIGNASGIGYGKCEFRNFCSLGCVSGVQIGRSSDPEDDDNNADHLHFSGFTYLPWNTTAINLVNDQSVMIT